MFRNVQKGMGRDGNRWAKKKKKSNINCSTSLVFGFWGNFDCRRICICQSVTGVFYVIASQPITERRPEAGQPTHKPGKHGDSPKREWRLEIRPLLTVRVTSSWYVKMCWS